jgi:hypothetical protein
MPELPSLALARLIVKSYLNDDFHPIIVYGDLRIGKSVYTTKALEQALDYLFGWKLTPTNLNRFMGWNPEENVESWLNEEERMPCYIWDDAGYWLHSLNWTDPTLISIQKYMNVVGTDYNVLIFTTPDPSWILSKIANMSGMVRVKIVKRSGSANITQLQEYRRFARRGIGYKPWKSPDLKRGGVNKVLDDEFSCKMPDRLYEWYKPIRLSYAKKAKLEIMKNLRNAKTKMEIDELKNQKKLRKLEKDLFDKVKDRKVKGIT